MSTKTLYQLCPVCLLSFFLALLFVVSCSNESDPTVYLTKTKMEAGVLAYSWVRSGNNYFINRGSQSMSPAIETGDYVMTKTYVNGTIPNKTIVVIDAGKYNIDMRKIKNDPTFSLWLDPNISLVCHRSMDDNGRAVYISGDNNRNSEGWIPKKYVVSICPLVIKVRNP